MVAFRFADKSVFLFFYNFFSALPLTNLRQSKFFIRFIISYDGQTVKENILLLPTVSDIIFL